MRICILGLANPLTWTAHFVKAFRQFGEVLTVGPPFGDEYLVTYKITHRPDLKRENDINVHLNGSVRLSELLPAGWEPDLIVGISDFGHPLGADMTGLRCPKVYLSIDTWQSPIDYADAIFFDAVFTAQKSFVPRLQATGSRHVYWLPLGADPEVHHPCCDAPERDISFAGSVAAGVHETRRGLLTRLRESHSVGHFENAYGEDFCRALCSGRLVFNHAAVNDLNMRVFEALAMGKLLLTNRESERNGLCDLFEDRKHLIIYDSAEHLLELAREFLENPDRARIIGEAGRAEVLAKHTYVHRVQTILDTVAALQPGFPASRPAQAPPESLLSLLPAGARRILDAGQSFTDSAPLLRALGAREILEAMGGAATGHGVLAWPPKADLTVACDVVLIGDLFRLGCAAEASLRTAHELLAPGGTLLLRVSDRELENLGVALEPGTIGAWMRRTGFHMTDMNYPALQRARRHIVFNVCARKRTRTLRDVVDEGMAEIAFPHASVHDIVAYFPGDM
ncbi:MAG: glycosyltransferase [Candidatus Hydrogenedentes bacterium]|nr:glycosyltransferase [Candidatus Hydrogenedentota bacterium]